MLFNIITMQESVNAVKEECISHNSTFQFNTSNILQCRICLQQDPEGMETLVSPCNCAGTLKFVHTQCLKRWIQKIVEDSKKNVEDSRAFISCQICKCKIEFSATSQLACKSLTQIKEGFAKSYKLFIALFLLLFINLGFFAALLNYLVFVGFRTLKENNVVLVSLIISGQVIFSIVAVVTIGAMLKIFVFKKSLCIELKRGQKKK